MRKFVETEGSQREKAPHYRTLAQGALLAVVLGLGWYAGYLFAPAQDSASPVGYEAGRLIAVGELESVLYNPSYQAGEEGPTAGLEFLNSAGETCRPFNDEQVKGVACRRGGDWAIAEMSQVEMPARNTPSPS